MILRFKDGTVVASGKLRKDPVKFRRVGSKDSALAEFGVLVKNERRADGTYDSEWLDCKAWYGLAEACAFLRPSSAVMISGKLETRSFAGRDGMEKSRTECVCDCVIQGITSLGAPSVPKPAEAKSPVDVAFDELGEDGGGELPF